MPTRSSTLSLLALAALVLAACGGSPSAPSSTEGVTLRGVAVGLPGLAAGPLSASARSSADDGDVTVVCVDNPAITDTVGPDGSFTLRGLPEGGFTLEFFRGAVSLGTVSFDEVKPNQQITITVDLSGSSVTLLEERRNGIGHGDLEIEGLVDEVRELDNEGDSLFVIDGYEVVARPGKTAIREGNTARTVDDVTVGRRVHVKGEWLDEGSPQPVLAWEIKLQGDDDGEEVGFTCTSGRKAEVEGIITGKSDAERILTVTQQGKGDYECTVGEGVRIRKGNTEYTFEELRPGWRVHVKGTQTGFEGEACGVQASEVKVQQT